MTGAAGFIGYHVAEALLARGERVIGVDCVNDYYDTRLKEARIERLNRQAGFALHRLDVADRDAMMALVAAEPGIEVVIHLAAQAGVRYSLIDPYAYVQANVMGHLVMQEAARRLPRVRHLVYASSSSVYGANRALPFAETDRVDTPLSVYAATKRADELLAHAYAHLFGLPQTGLRFFTVYGPWGRPDMAYYSFARAIVAGEPITLYDEGRLRRDFTYVDDVVTGIVSVLDKPPAAAEGARVLNIGNHRSETVRYLVDLLERELGRAAIVRTAPRPEADVEETFAAVD
ncbi:MAG: NAD-dependent epimerase/dehydratase family protein, partial [Rhodospirillales bacterium]|nr:NAD-dependent epimerase/dehydratase family protein [Rhodospirillales bacterium]